MQKHRFVFVTMLALGAYFFLAGFGMILGLFNLLPEGYQLGGMIATFAGFIYVLLGSYLSYLGWQLKRCVPWSRMVGVITYLLLILIAIANMGIKNFIMILIMGYCVFLMLFDAEEQELFS